MFNEWCEKNDIFVVISDAFDDLLGGGADGDSDTEAPDDNQVV